MSTPSAIASTKPVGLMYLPLAGGVPTPPVQLATCRTRRAPSSDDRERSVTSHRCLLRQALRDAALDRQPAEGWVEAFELHPVSLTDLRKELSGMLPDAPHEAVTGCRVPGSDR
jgi:hypothetical protein